MKKFSVLLTLAVLMVSSSVFAGSLDYLSNQSAKFLMNQASTARTDGADIVAYNPAGTALMGQGFFIDVSNQTLLKYYSEEVKWKEGTTAGVGGDVVNIDKEYKQDKMTPLLPNVYIVFNAGQVGMGKLAVYGQAGVTAGGGSLEWDGLAGADKSMGQFALAFNALAGFGGAPTKLVSTKFKVEASSVYYDFGGGVAYSLLEDMLSISAGAKYVMARRSGSLKGTGEFMSYGGPFGAGADWNISIDSEWDYDANGYTPVFGLDVKPMKELTLGLRYEMETKLKFKYDQSKNDATLGGTAGAAVDGAASAVLGVTAAEYVESLTAKTGKFDSNLPQILSVGAEYIVTPELTVSAGSNIYFMSKADMDGLEKMFGTGWEASLCASYKVMDALKIGGGFTYTDQGVKDKYLEDEDELNTTSANPILDSIMIGLGATYTVIPNLDITLAGAWVHYLPADADIAISNPLAAGSFGTMKNSYKKDVYNIALGASYKI